VLVACSGGPDSTALALACAELARDGRLGAVALGHIDHQLRDGSAADGDRVAALGAALDLPVHRAAVVVDRSRASLEDAARDARYAALDAMAGAIGADYIATGHTASDQAETVLMRVVRGTGVTGLAGIPRRRDRYVRPLLDLPRAAIEDELARRGVEAAGDPMNDDDALTRNRVRRVWLPALRRENPAVDDALLRLARSAAEQREVLEWAVDRVDLTAEAIASAPAAVAKAALGRAAVAAGAGPLSAAHLEDLLGLMVRDESGTVDLSLPGAIARREYGRLRFVTPAQDGAIPTASVEVDGEDGPYRVRCWQRGDRMRPARLRGRSRKLSDLFTDAKIPRSQRDRAVVVERERDGAIVWAEHIGPAHASSVTVSLTRKVPVATNKE
jgi:tRNA(Ile)-lysidine synthase